MPASSRRRSRSAHTPKRRTPLRRPPAVCRVGRVAWASRMRILPRRRRNPSISPPRHTETPARTRPPHTSRKTSRRHRTRPCRRRSPRTRTCLCQPSRCIAPHQRRFNRPDPANLASHRLDRPRAHTTSRLCRHHRLLHLRSPSLRCSSHSRRRLPPKRSVLLQRPRRRASACHPSRRPRSRHTRLPRLRKSSSRVSPPFLEDSSRMEFPRCRIRSLRLSNRPVPVHRARPQPRQSRLPRPSQQAPRRTLR